MRFYELDGGRITLDGVDITELTRHDLRSRIGMVLQDTWLFGGTIRDNIAYGNPDATEEEILAAAKATYVDRFVHSLPDGYDTVIDEEGSNVSAGEKQLLTIARAFLADPQLLILDEATSSVDTRTEVLVQHAMAALRVGPDQLRDRAPAVHDPRRRPDPGDGGRRDRRAGHPPASCSRPTAPTPALYNAQFSGAVVDIDEEAAAVTAPVGAPARPRRHQTGGATSASPALRAWRPVCSVLRHDELRLEGEQDAERRVADQQVAAADPPGRGVAEDDHRRRPSRTPSSRRPAATSAATPASVRRSRS